jgi:hypothetical protein
MCAQFYPCDEVCKIEELINILVENERPKDFTFTLPNWKKPLDRHYCISEYRGYKYCANPCCFQTQVNTFFFLLLFYFGGGG